MTLLRLLILLLLLTACEKPNPNPEKGDGVYLDLSSQADALSKDVESEKKKLEGLKKEVLEAKPYSGELRSAQKRFFESEKKINQLKQQKYFYTLRARTRKELVRAEYIKNYAEKKVWDSSDESKGYQNHEKLLKAPLGWDAKRRIANYTQETGFGASAAGKPKASPAAAPKGH